MRFERKLVALVSVAAGCMNAVAQDSPVVTPAKPVTDTKSLYPPDRDYLQERMELVRRTQVPNFDPFNMSNGWPTFLRVVSGSRGAMVFATASPGVKAWIAAEPQGSRSTQDLLDAASGLCKAATPELIAEGRRFLDQYNESPLAAELDMLADEPMFVPAGPMESPALLHLLPHLGDARQTARICAARMSYASIVGDEKALIRAYSNVLALSKPCSYEGYVISSLVSNAIDSLAYTRLTEVLRARPVSAATLRELLRVTEAAQRAEWSISLDGERLSSLDSLNWVYVTSNFKMFEKLSSPSKSKLGDGLMDRLRTWTFAPREESLAKLDEFFLSLRSAMDPDATVAADAVAKSEALVKELGESPRYYPASILMPAMVRTVQVERMTRTSRSGMRLILAIEAFRTERGELPKTIEELSGILGKEPLLDWHDPVRLAPRYKAIDAAPGYVVYSVGRDGIDHGGIRDGANPTGEAGKGSPADCILNWVEPTRVE